MDTEAQPTERDRSSRPSRPGAIPDPERREDRSRFALAGRRRAGSADTDVHADGDADGAGPGESRARVDGPAPDEGRSGRLLDLLPGGRISLTLLICLLFLLLLNAFVVKPFQIPSGSMENGLRIGDRVLVNRLAYLFGGEPRRGDVVVFDGTGYFGDADYVKRVVGVGRDHVVCCDKEGRIEVNGRAVDESAFLYPGDSPSTVPFDVVVPEGALFVLGDHRAESRDSRDHLGSPGGGMIPVDRVVGRADGIVWPPAHLTRLHRPDAYAPVPAPGAAPDASAARSLPRTASTPSPLPTASTPPLPDRAGAHG
ncbi:signal peptidase I [Streptomyces sp. NPDC086091]|uniref:signal peptidase I n=1 Tax=Streptomyces sp. NPDC086091 TaxID=3365751 RepID=UPI0038291C6B